MGSSDFIQHRQFFKADPNQMALPGMEHISPNPVAPALASGRLHVEHEVGMYQHSRMGVPTGPAIEAGHHLHLKTDSGRSVASLDWRAQQYDEKTKPEIPGEIQYVHTDPLSRGHGYATMLYGVGRKMMTYKPRHSRDRTYDGEGWAPKATRSFGGYVPERGERHERRAKRVPPTPSAAPDPNQTSLFKDRRS